MGILGADFWGILMWVKFWFNVRLHWIPSCWIYIWTCNYDHFWQTNFETDPLCCRSLRIWREVRGVLWLKTWTSSCTTFVQGLGWKVPKLLVLVYTQTPQRTEKWLIPRGGGGNMHSTWISRRLGHTVDGEGSTCCELETLQVLLKALMYIFIYKVNWWTWFFHQQISTVSMSINPPKPPEITLGLSGERPSLSSDWWSVEQDHVQYLLIQNWMVSTVSTTHTIHIWYIDLTYLKNPTNQMMVNIPFPMDFNGMR